ncbi:MULTISPECIES: LysR family transcriptional regulator [Rhodopseudomonas]|uniref:LysR family transcriptional regulator n=1 Tax=Rhodopseudomonas palustris TaxID=1076 RepID=A0A0D7EQQ9_RHOPL|nr:MULTISPECIES: LysR family transcriptional regulator [Rhodopseudomonas]KIZ43164.1 LysR family transcriptional regulator [Rhodopseudomonas palustris]MDF3809526.1 LysR family transcriptional regulator [Rhodopseudomonas sp. BAL398]WOK19728.1 LysR family transcriptional regulator [Rhodopseudomonas sp. BAL398]
MYEKFEYLLALEREKHFGRAAQVCGVSQPNLSAALKQLELQFGVMLVDRGARFMGFTPEGLRILDWARSIVGEFRAMEAEIELMKLGNAGHLRIAAIPTALPILSLLTNAYWARHPGVHVSISSCTSAEVLSRLDNLEADIGITYFDLESVGRNAELPLYHERYCLIAARDMAMMDRPTVTWEEVAKMPLCLPLADTQNRRIYDRIFKEIGVTVQPALESNDYTVRISHLRGGRLATVMPRIMAGDWAMPAELVAVPIVAPETSTLIGLIYPKRDPMPPLTVAMISEARQLVPVLTAMS